MQTYDTGNLIASAVKAVGGKLGNRDGLRAALRKADFKSLRGGFRFGKNHYPIQDFYLVKVAKRADGKYQTEIAERVFKDDVDRYAAECAMK
jgi:branched-chain amino acid transport system substrate-binding protein